MSQQPSKAAFIVDEPLCDAVSGTWLQLRTCGTETIGALYSKAFYGWDKTTVLFLVIKGLMSNSIRILPAAIDALCKNGIPELEIDAYTRLQLISGSARG